MLIYGPAHWHEDVQACTKHGVPQLPCTACLEEKDPQIQAMLDQGDRTALDTDPELKIADLMPAAYPWLIERLA